MNFRIADTFTDSLSRLTGDEQKAVKTTAFDLQLNPASPGMSFHKLDRARDKNFWSVRVSSDIRLIVHRTQDSLLLCYVGHHDAAYAWAERRRLETHPTTGAAQLVEIRETVREIFIPVYTQVETQAQPRPAAPQPPLFAAVSADDLLGYGVPTEWMDDVRRATEDSLLALTDHLPAEAAEALLELATGGQPRIAHPAAASASPFDHPDALRRFRVMTNVDELEHALDFPWDKWTIFLHPDQRQWVERDFNGPARVSGSAGTGKTIVALHRAAHLARTHRAARVLLTTFSEALAHGLQAKLRLLLHHEPMLADQIEVASLDAIALRLYEARIGRTTIATDKDLQARLRDAAAAVAGHAFKLPFLFAEWDHVVDAWQLTSWEAYRDVPRLGRRTRLPEAQREVLWSIFKQVRFALASSNRITRSELYTALGAHIASSGQVVFDFIVVDEAQDVSVAQLRFLAALGGARPNALFFAGDLGQRIFQQPFSWRSLGVDVRGRARTLRVNYRTSHQIRTQADQLLGPAVEDMDGNVEVRTGTVSVFNGPPPTVVELDSDDAEIRVVAEWLAECASDGVLPHEIGVFVRSDAQLDRARAAIEAAGLQHVLLDERVASTVDHVSLSTMHLAKGLEFRAVAVMACDDEVVPLQARLADVGEGGDLKEAYETERHLLYVACTRARDHLLVTGVSPASEFLDDLRG